MTTATASRTASKPATKPAAKKRGASRAARPPGQLVLVLQGGGALGAYQVGVYEAMHEAGLEPEWVIGTSIGAINAAIISGNKPADRLERLNEFWSRIEHQAWGASLPDWFGLGNTMANAATMLSGISSFFSPNPAAWRGQMAEIGIEKASYYSTAPLRETLAELVDFDYLCECRTRLTVGAVNAASGEMRYFDSRDEPLGVDHIVASGALPPSFGAVRIEGDPYWDGGIYSNTPIEAVLDDKPRKDSVIFAVNVWHQAGPEPESIWQVMGRVKDIQYASRADSHILRQKQIHHLRHVIRELTKQIAAGKQASEQVEELAAWGCSTTMHVAHLVAPRLDTEDHTKDIDFTAEGISRRRKAGYADTLRMIERAPWQDPVDPMEGVIEHR